MGHNVCVRFVRESTAHDVMSLQAMVRLHWGGPPQMMKDLFDQFFEDVEAQCGTDTRFNVPDLMVSRFVVQCAKEHNYEDDFSKPLNFLSVYIDTLSVKQAVESEGADTYAVVCHSDGRGRLRPTVLYDEMLFTETREIAHHAMTEINEYIEAERLNREEQDNAELV
jgi:hypothetical protein